MTFLSDPESGQARCSIPLRTTRRALRPFLRTLSQVELKADAMSLDEIDFRVVESPGPWREAILEGSKDVFETGTSWSGDQSNFFPTGGLCVSK
jgi:hypothetical protein